MEEWEWWLRFNRLNIAPRRQLRLLEHFGSPRAVFQASVAALAQVEGFDRSIGPKMEAVRALDVRPDWEQLERLQATLVTYYDENYPPLLRQIADPPPLLYLLGQLCPEDQRAVAIVGSRRSSPYGRLVAENLSKGLVSYGATIVSGLARGIDAAAHQGALRAGGRTIAVLGCGLDVIYPRENRALREEISERGAVLTEFPLGTRPEAWRFPARNRLISGLSRAVVIVEAPLNSGALITADYALEQGREVFAVPGNVTNSRN
ncbi:MAG TPA: DNA-protecting protein DprA, partial [Armatimonadetes bacterium]|nr:DNA-protecting protein DprA [Armatimonadota bacterium]